MPPKIKTSKRPALCIVIALCFTLSWQNSSPAADPIPDHTRFQLDSEILDETRILYVWTPPGYDESQDRYPVLYMLDGGIKEDFPHIANTLAELIAEDLVPPTILVGIENTERRRDLTGPSRIASDAEIAPTTDGSSKFRRFIRKELFPAVDQRFRINQQRSVIGESVAGLFVVETLLLNPGMFDRYIAMDPSIYWNDNYLVESAAQHLGKLPNTNIRFWFAGSRVIDIQPHVRELAAILSTSAPKQLEWTYSDQPKEKHSTILRATKKQAMVWSLGRGVK